MQYTEQISKLDQVGKLIDAGYKVIPKDGKEPASMLRHYGAVKKIKENPIHHQNAVFYFRDDNVDVGIFLGDGIEAIDFETPYVQSGQYANTENYFKYTHPEILSKLTIERNAKGNPKWFYRCKKTAGKKVLARREPTPEELARGERTILLIEVLGEDCQANIYPSNGYQQVQGDLLLLQEITPEEREIIHGELATDNKIIEPDYAGIRREQYKSPKAAWNVFNEKHGNVEWMIETLRGMDFEIGQERGKIPVKRSGSTGSKYSGSILTEGDIPVLFLFSTNTIFPANIPLRPFDIIKHAKYDGNFHQCAKAQAEQGYGEFKQELEISFFDITPTNKKGHVITVNQVRFLDLIQSFGVRLYPIDRMNNIYIRINGHALQQISIEQIKKLVKAHVEAFPETHDCGITRAEFLEALLKGSDRYFGKGLIEFIPRFEQTLLEDTADTAYLPFPNGVVCITADKIELKNYEELGKYIWKDAIINHEISIDNADLTNAVWYQFYSCISGHPDPKQLTPEQVDRFFYLQSLTGYIIHRYKDPAKPFAVILAEAIESATEGGGTGKGLYTKGIGNVISLCVIAGKNLDLTSRFTWQRYEPHHTAAVIDDVPQNFKLELLYNAITEGLTVEGKGLPQIFVPYEKSPKLIVISNYVISTIGNHASRRQKLFEFAPFFSPRNTPENHFGHILFNTWDREEWNRFYNVQISCVMRYLKDGLPETEKSDTLKRREIKQRFTEPFAEWYLNKYLSNGCDKWQSTKTLYEEFLTYAEIDKEEFSQKKFTTAIVQTSCIFLHDPHLSRETVGGKLCKVVRVVKKSCTIEG